MTKPNEPTLTCSEVVERLAQIAESTLTEFDAPLCVTKRAADRTRLIAAKLREQSPAILHYWRERRVQELEEALRITSASIAKEMNRYDYEELDGSGAIITAEEVYKQSLEKAAEQIRKGAKHE